MTTVRVTSTSGQMTSVDKRDTDVCDQKFSSDLIRRTLEIWQPRTSRNLTEEDARKIIENTVEFLQLLRQWRRSEMLENGSVDASSDNAK